MYDATYPSASFSLQLLLAEAAAAYSVAAQRLSGDHTLATVRKLLSHGFTVLLFLISLAGAVELVHMAGEAAAPATSGGQKVSAASAPVRNTDHSATAQAKSLAPSTPTHIRIPAVSVDAILDTVGLNQDGSLQVPYRDDAGWYKGSPTPGEIGPAIIDGHVDSVYGIAVFWYLRNLKSGDTISIDRADGSTVNFTVEQVASYDQHTFPSDKVYGNISYAGLRLITCDGTFDYATRHYSKNLVVYARANL